MKKMISLLMLFFLFIGVSISWADVLDISDMQLRVTPNASASMYEAIDGGIVISVTATNGDHWAANGYFKDIPIEAEKEYLVRFKASSDEERPCVVQLNENGQDWSVYAEKWGYLTPEPTWNEVVLTAPVSDTTSLLIFNVGTQVGAYTFYEVEFSEYVPENGILHLGKAIPRTNSDAFMSSRLISGTLELEVLATSGDFWAAHVDWQPVPVTAGQVYSMTVVLETDFPSAFYAQLLSGDGRWSVLDEERVLVAGGVEQRKNVLLKPASSDENSILALNFGSGEASWVIKSVSFQESDLSKEKANTGDGYSSSGFDDSGGGGGSCFISFLKQ